MLTFIKKLYQRKIALVVVIVALVVGGYFIYRSFVGGGTTATQYVTAKAQKGTIVVSVSGSGQVAASNQINVQPQVSGVVAKVFVENNQSVKAGDLLVKLDTTDNERAVRNAKANLEIAELALQTLEQPPTTSTLLQAQGAVMQAQWSLENARNNLKTDYNSAFTDISNTFIDIPAVMTGLNNILYGTTVNKYQANIDAYVNLISNYYPNVYDYSESAASSYAVALSTYNQNLADFKNANIYSSTSTVESLLTETYNTLKGISAANSDIKNFLDIVSSVLQQNSQRTFPTQLNADENNLQSYIASVNSHFSTISQIQNALISDKQSIDTDTLSISQTAASLDQLESGPTQLEIKSKEMAVTQAQNSLNDAEQNLNYDYIRAPFDGVITNITAKVGQPAGSSIGTLVGNTQLAQATLNETDVVNVKVGQKATITFDALPDLTLTGKVSEVDTVGTVSQGVVSYNVQVALDVPNPDVKPGMSDTFDIITNTKQDVLIVPNSAVTTKQGVSYVSVLGSDGKPKQQEVTIGLSNDSMTEITSGLNEGDAVVTQTITSKSSASTATTNSRGLLGGGGGPPL